MQITIIMYFKPQKAFTQLGDNNILFAAGETMSIPSFILIGCCVSELHGHLCPYRNVWTEAVYCSFIRTTMFTELFTC